MGCFSVTLIWNADVEIVVETCVLKLHLKCMCWNCTWNVCVETALKICVLKLNLKCVCWNCTWNVCVETALEMCVLKLYLKYMCENYPKIQKHSKRIPCNSGDLFLYREYEIHIIEIAVGMNANKKFTKSDLCQGKKKIWGTKMTIDSRNGHVRNLWIVDRMGT